MCDVSAPTREPGKLVAWAEQRLHVGSLTAAEACVEVALRARPDLGHAHYIRGGVYVISGDAVSALPHFERAVHLTPTHADAYFELGNALYAHRRLSRAEHSYRSALRIAPTRSLCLLNLANVLAERGATVVAERSYREALTLMPSGFDGCAAANGLINLLAASQRDREAEHVARRALRSTRWTLCAASLGRRGHRRSCVRRSHASCCQTRRSRSALWPRT